ncbi:MAG TPA: ATP-binding protein [Polyangiaceae bacterium]|jgi:signal transduction histidine kinase|nr:ATP-binding protein [Polyangiaceae bacterium]
MRLTLRRKLGAIVVLAAVAFVALLISASVIANRTARDVERIQTEYLPRVELEPRLEGEFERLGRGFQDAVSARDADSLADTEPLRSRFLQELEGAAGAIGQSRRDELRVALDGYCDAAADVSRRLIASESGERLLDDIASMQRKQARVQDLIKATTSFDRRELIAALASVRAAGVRGLQYELAICVVCFVTVAVVSAWLGRDVVRGLAQLIAGLERFGKGDFKRPIPAADRDEIDDVAVHANQMAANLERLDGENQSVQAALKASNQELEAFSYSVAHDLRAPLRAISGFAEILAETQIDRLDDEGRKCIDAITRNTEKMARLIDALLSLSRLSRKEMNPREVDLSEIAREEIADLARSDRDRSVDVTIQDGVEGRADPNLARAVLQNLLGNAWKFTAKTPAARVEFGVADKDGVRAFFVRDNGAGFDMSYAKNLFGAFQRLHTEAEFKGTGIGLATVHRIVSRHGGRLWAEGAVNAGATFYFTLSRS